MTDDHTIRTDVDGHHRPRHRRNIGSCGGILWCYRALDAQGAVRSGYVTATHPRVAARRLKEQGLYAVAIRAGSPAAAAGDARRLSAGSTGDHQSKRGRGWSRGDRPLSCACLESMRASIRMMVKRIRRERGSPRLNAEFYEALADLLEAGLTLDNALAVLARIDRKKGGWYEASVFLAKALREGTSFPDAMRRLPGSDPCQAAFVAAAGLTGRWETALRALARWDRRRREWTHRLMASLLYPVWLLGTGCAAMMVMIHYVIPQMQAIYQEWDTPLPWMTRAALVVFDGTARVMPAAAVSASGTALLTGLLLRRPSFRRRLRAALWHNAVWRFYWSRWHSAVIFDAMGFLMREGVDVMAALRVSASLSPFPEIRNRLQEAACGMAGGQGLNALLADLWPLSASTEAVIQCGWAAGRAGDGFAQAARQAEKELVRSIDGFLVGLQPALLSGMAVFIGLTMTVFFWPLFNTMRLMF